MRNVFYFGILILMAGCSSSEVKVGNENVAPAQTESVTAAAPVAPVKESLAIKEITYDVIKTQFGDRAVWYDACIKEINPAKDDYKAYCRFIVADLVKKYGTNKIAVAIYDSKKAQQLYGVNYQQKHQILNKNDKNYVSQHTIGLYAGGLDGDPDTYELSYYTDAEGMKQYKGRENFKP